MLVEASRRYAPIVIVAGEPRGPAVLSAVDRRLVILGGAWAPSMLAITLGSKRLGAGWACGQKVVAVAILKVSEPGNLTLLRQDF